MPVDITVVLAFPAYSTFSLFLLYNLKSLFLAPIGCSVLITDGVKDAKQAEESIS